MIEVATAKLIGKSLDSIDGPIASRVASLAFWNDIFAEKIPEEVWFARRMKALGFIWRSGGIVEYMNAVTELYDYGLCKVCDSLGTVSNVYGYHYCICWLLKEEVRLKDTVSAHSSMWTPQYLKDLRTNFKVSPKELGSLVELKEAIKITTDWIVNPSRWLVYSGGTGTGKTHMLNAIMAAWQPWSIFIVASDFEAKLRQYLNNGGNGIEPYIQALINHPILIIDDIGIEYSSPWIAAKLDAVIEARSRIGHWWDRLTIIATNLQYGNFKSQFVRDGISRTGSRLLDTEMVEWIGLSGPDYRMQK